MMSSLSAQPPPPGSRSAPLHRAAAQVVAGALARQGAVKTLVYNHQFQFEQMDDYEEEEDAAKRKAFGTRFLVDESRVFEHNAWDQVEWTDEQHEEALRNCAKQAEKPVGAERAAQLLSSPADHWDAFYQTHQNKFFMDRRWLLTEFPELDMSQRSESEVRVLEVGCGVGNTSIPLLQWDTSRKMRLTATDFSETAVSTMMQHEDWDAERACAFPWDITKPPPEELKESSFDVILAIYVLSAVPPASLNTAIAQLSRLLKPDGVLLVKDYGRHDLAQLRFKGDRYLAENFYCRGDGTLVYFFETDELDAMMYSCGLEPTVPTWLDRRLIVNRAKQQKMYRCWLQAKYRRRKTDTPA